MFAVPFEDWDTLLMQGEERMDRQFLDAAALAGHLVPENSIAFLAAHRGDLFPMRTSRTCSHQSVAAPRSRRR